MISTTDGNSNTVEYTYNPEGVRIEKSDGTNTTRFVYDDNGLDNSVSYIYEQKDKRIAKAKRNNKDIVPNLILELDDLDNQLASNIYGLALITRSINNTTGYYLYNGHGDVVKIVDDQNVVLNTYEYDAFGNIDNETETMDNPYRYAGYYYDIETENYYLMARYYNPAIARFITEDTYRGQYNEPLSLNRYVYVKNNPLIYIDRTGRDAIYITGSDMVNGWLFDLPWGRYGKVQAGHTSMIIQDENEEWWYYFYGAGGTEVTKVDEKAMSSLEEFSKWTQASDPNSIYDSATYIEGDFTEALKYARDQKGKAEDLKFNPITKNCTTETMKLLQMGKNEEGYFNYTDLHYSSVVPNNNVGLISKIFGNTSFTKEGADREKSLQEEQKESKRNSLMFGNTYQQEKKEPLKKGKPSILERISRLFLTV